MALLFDKKKIEQAEKDYSKLNLGAAQRAQIEPFVKMYRKSIPISEMAMRGFITLALRDFQVQTHIETGQLMQMAPAERAKQFELITKLIYEKLSHVLLKPDQQQALLKAIREAMQAGSRL